MADDDWDYALSRGGRTLHIMPADRASAMGAEALCGQRLERRVHPSDHRDGGRVCKRCEQWSVADGSND